MPVESMTLREVERQIVLVVLDKHAGDKRLAAQELGIALKTMYNKLNQYTADTAEPPAVTAVTAEPTSVESRR